MKSIKRRVSYREVVDRCSPAIFKYDIKNVPDPEKEEEYEFHDFCDENTVLSDQREFAMVDAGIENFISANNSMYASYTMFRDNNLRY